MSNTTEHYFKCGYEYFQVNIVEINGRQYDVDGVIMIIYYCLC